MPFCFYAIPGKKNQGIKGGIKIGCSKREQPEYVCWIGVLRHLVVNGWIGYTMFCKYLGNVSLLFGVNCFFAVFEPVVKAFSKMFHQVLLDGRSNRSIYVIVNIVHAQCLRGSSSVVVICCHCYDGCGNVSRSYKKLLSSAECPV